MTKKNNNSIIKLRNFATQNTNAKKPIQLLIKHITRETNRHKFDYDQLRYVFKSVRTNCNIEVPRRKQKLIELPTNEDLASFYRSISNPDHKLIFEFLENTGIRVEKLCALEVSRVDLDSNTAMIVGAKGGKDRIVIFGNQLKEKLALYLNQKKRRYLFESNRHTRFSPRRIEQLCRQYKDASSIEKTLTPHTFRHIWNTRLAEAGVSREHREMLAGHAKGSKSQDIYTHLGLAGIKKDIVSILDGEND